jgi:hypothetical protein
VAWATEAVAGTAALVQLNCDRALCRQEERREGAVALNNVPKTGDWPCAHGACLRKYVVIAVSFMSPFARSRAQLRGRVIDRAPSEPAIQTEQPSRFG